MAKTVIQRIPDKEYAKALGQTRLQLNGIMSTFDMYGLGVAIPSAIEAIMEVVEQFGMRVRGKDIPIKTTKKVVNCK